MVDTVDSKSAARKGVRVQVPPGVPRALNISALTFFQIYSRKTRAFFTGFCDLRFYKVKFFHIKKSLYLCKLKIVSGCTERSLESQEKRLAFAAENPLSRIAVLVRSSTKEGMQLHPLLLYIYCTKTGYTQPIFGASHTSFLKTNQA